MYKYMYLYHTSDVTNNNDAEMKARMRLSCLHMQKAGIFVDHTILKTNK